jgi:hypothetical protein
MLNFFVLSLTAMFTGIVATLAGVSATLTPLAGPISEITGMSIESVLMTQVFGFSTILFTYQGTSKNPAISQLRERSICPKHLLSTQFHVDF